MLQTVRFISSCPSLRLRTASLRHVYKYGYYCDNRCSCLNRSPRRCCVDGSNESLYRTNVHPHYREDEYRIHKALSGLLDISWIQYMVVQKQNQALISSDITMAESISPPA